MRNSWPVPSVNFADIHVRKSLYLLVAQPAADRGLHRALGRCIYFWPLPGRLDDTQLEALPFPLPAIASEQRPLPDWGWVHRELAAPM